MSTPTFAPEERLSLAELRVGDWIESIPTQRSIAGRRLQSGIASLQPGSAWIERRGRFRQPVPSLIITTLSGATVELPAEFTALVRRREEAQA